MDTTYALEMGRAGYIIAHDMCRIQQDESVLITIDSISDTAPAMAVAQAAEALGAKVMLIWHSTPHGYAKVAEARMADGLKAVSYTHLDVYKRQVMSRTIWQIL